VASLALITGECTTPLLINTRASTPQRHEVIPRKCLDIVLCIPFPSDLSTIPNPFTCPNRNPDFPFAMLSRNLKPPRYASHCDIQLSLHIPVLQSYGLLINKPLTQQQSSSPLSQSSAPPRSKSHSSSSPSQPPGLPSRGTGTSA